MADASNVRHDTIVAPETMSPAQVRALAERKAQAQVGDDDMVAFLHLHGSRPVGDEHDTEVEWRYSYQVIGCDSLSWPQWDDLKWLHCAVAGVLKGRLDLAPSLRHAASVMTT